MPRILFVSFNGDRQDVEVADGLSAMSAARLNNIGGIEAECGGSLSCGTCHVYVNTVDLGKLPPPTEQEEEMLELVASGRKPNSRLSCQLLITEDLDGIEIQIPELQY